MKMYLPKHVCLLIISITIVPHLINSDSISIDQSLTNMPRCASGDIQVGGRVSSFHDFATISYPSKDTAMSNIDKSHDVLLLKRYDFTQEGIHIWRDSYGTWNLQYRGNHETDIIVMIWGCQIHEDIAVIGNNPKFTHKGSDTLLISIQSNVLSCQIQFRAVGLDIDFDVVNNGQRNPNCIHLGAWLTHPIYVPFRIENRPISLNQKNLDVISNNDVGEEKTASKVSSTSKTVVEATRETSTEFRVRGNNE